MDEQFTFPKPPPHLQIPKHHVYLGCGDDIPTLTGNYCGYYGDGYPIEDIRGHFIENKLEGSSRCSHYSVEFGSPEWNKWAEVMFDLTTIPDGFVWIGKNPNRKGVVTDTFDGAYHTKWTSRHSPWPCLTKWMKVGYIEDYWSDLEYCINITDPQYNKARKYFTNLHKSDVGGEDLVSPSNDHSDPVLVKLEAEHQKLIESYHKAHEELQEARTNGWGLRIDGRLAHPVLDCFRYIITNNKLCFSDGFLQWSADKVKTIKEQPAPSFEVNGYKPEYHKDYWKFGCAKIGHLLIHSLIVHSLIDMDKGGDGDYKNITAVTIGKGTFTIDQLIELNNYRKNRLHA